MSDEAREHGGTPDATARGAADDAPAPRGVSRRDALRVLGIAGVAAAGAGAVGAAACAPDSAGQLARPGGAATATGLTGTKPPYFTPHERETVTVLVDYIIPRDARSGSATDAGVPAWMDAFLSDPDTEDSQRQAIRGGLAWLDFETRRRAGVPFAQASDAARRGVLDDIAYPKRARPEMSQGVAFFNRFRDFTASGFFSSQMGQKDLQYEGNVAVPVWDGCPPAALAKLGVSYELMAT
ncbi:MAG TPA: gluconate 2-dehydrogenase subunit 3 family protein, partial [Gemmatirosa sp.]